ncbi:hypothetical protein NBRC110019_19250 [Neptunitalea chrysea]|uniref:Uncharacterized protein n=2 Tax=Neptunitalea chrysea TaxID=1647581 RepID=A0A9W6B5E6_9FLAO|nr:hypothetical protein NBRC110019_19250 [Neptunitalea chrysea]
MVVLAISFSSLEVLKSITYLDITINFVILLISVLLLAFLFYKNKLTNHTTYAVAIYVLLIGCFPEVMVNREILIANLLFILGARRLLSLHSLKSVKAKIFDSFLLIGIGAFVYHWGVLLLLMCYITIVLYDAKDIRNWLIPLVVFGLLYLGYVLYQFYIIKDCVIVFTLPEDLKVVTFGFPKYNRVINYISIGYILPVGVFGMLSYLASFQSKSISFQKPYWFLTFLFVLSIFLQIVDATNKSVVIFTFFPLVVFIALLIEKQEKKHFKELLLWPLLLLAVLSLVL